MVLMRLIDALRGGMDKFLSMIKINMSDWSGFREIFIKEIALEFGVKEWKNFEGERNGEERAGGERILGRKHSMKERIEAVLQKMLRGQCQVRHKTKSSNRQVVSFKYITFRAAF